jgi:hypothetical protein
MSHRGKHRKASRDSRASNVVVGAIATGAVASGWAFGSAPAANADSHGHG